jgi:hypothetical protein
MLGLQKENPRWKNFLSLGTSTYYCLGLVADYTQYLPETILPLLLVRTDTHRILLELKSPRRMKSSLLSIII